MFQIRNRFKDAVFRSAIQSGTDPQIWIRNTVQCCRSKPICDGSADPSVSSDPDPDPDPAPNLIKKLSTVISLFYTGLVDSVTLTGPNLVGTVHSHGLYWHSQGPLEALSRPL